MKKILFLIILFLIVLFSKSIYASEITSITGTISNGNELTISGSDLGTKSTAAPLIFDNFENGSDGDYLTTVGWTKYGGSDDGGKISTDRATSGTRSAHNYATAINGDGFETNYQTFTASDTVYCYYKYYAGGTGERTITEIMKQSRITAGSDSSPAHYGAPHTVIQWQPRYDWTYANLNNGDESIQENFADNVKLRTNNWETIEYNVELGTAGESDGIIQMMVNGISAWNDTSFVSRATGETFQYQSFWLGLVAENVSGTLEYNVYIDDVYVDNTPVRVILCDNIDGTGHSEIQIPHHWSATDVGITVNQGTFTAGTKVYIIVYDTDNAIIATFETEIGESGTPPEDPTPPSATGVSCRIS